jgi:ubiquinone/menaquinone biosynthesis C-methylase UbiE
VPWDIFEQAASRYAAWYTTPSGQRADAAERALLTWLLAGFPTARSVLEVGCGTGHFTTWLAHQGWQVVGLDRAPAMLAHLHQHFPDIPVIMGDAHRLPMRQGAVDLVVFVTTLEFLEDPAMALAEAVRVARQGLVVVALNAWSVGGLSRRWGSQARQSLLSRARDYSVRSLRAVVRQAAGKRLQGVRWASTLLPAGLWQVRAPIPVGDVIGLGATLLPLDPSADAADMWYSDSVQGLRSPRILKCPVAGALSCQRGTPRWVRRPLRRCSVTPSTKCLAK